MPNTSATVRSSTTAIAKGSFVTEKDIDIVKKLFQAIGSVSIVKEEQMHAITALSGSGPAYIYYLAEALEKAAIKEGLDPETAHNLTVQTIIGAGQMLQNTPESTEQLRHKVTSPNGTTAAGIETLQEYNFAEAIEKCVQNAMKRSEKLEAEIMNKK